MSEREPPRAEPPRAEPPLPGDIVEQINAIKGGLDSTLGITFLAVTYEEVRAELMIGQQHLQPYGLVHGGVYASVAESLASVGAAVTAIRSVRPGARLRLLAAVYHCGQPSDDPPAPAHHRLRPGGRTAGRPPLYG